MTTPKFIPLAGYQEYPPDEMKQRAVSFYEQVRPAHGAQVF